MRGKQIDLSGKKYGSLTVQSIADKSFWKTPSSHWICKCECGNTRIVRCTHLTGGSVKSCGCLSKKTKSNHPRWKGYNEISRRTWNSILNSAQRRSIDVTITIEEAWNIFIKQNEQCALTGLPLKFASRDNKWDGTASLDRIDSDKPYSRENVQWVHKDVNLMKHTLTTQKLIEYSKLIYFYNL